MCVSVFVCEFVYVCVSVYDVRMYACVFAYVCECVSEYKPCVRVIVRACVRLGL